MLIPLLVTIVVLLVVGGLLFYAVDLVPMAATLRIAIKVLLLVIAVVIILSRFLPDVLLVR